tara:strand:+ start:114 stop:254 length:141 start_codon:yes stop_codon:yes gene_type:complete
MIENLLYLDAGTGSAILVFIVSSAAGLSVFIKTKWDRIRNRTKIGE